MERYTVVSQSSQMTKQSALYLLLLPWVWLFKSAKYSGTNPARFLSLHSSLSVIEVSTKRALCAWSWDQPGVMFDYPIRRVSRRKGPAQLSRVCEHLRAGVDIISIVDGDLISSKTWYFKDIVFFIGAFWKLVLSIFLQWWSNTEKTLKTGTVISPLHMA